MNIYGGYPHSWYEPKEAKTVRYIVIYRRPEIKGLRATFVSAESASDAVTRAMDLIDSLSPEPVAVGPARADLRKVRLVSKYEATSEPFGG